MIELQINGRVLSVPEAATILDASRLAGIEIPTLCHDERLAAAGLCRLCLVEVAGQSRPQPACATPVRAGMVVETHTADLEAGRRAALEFLAWNYPAREIERRPDKPFHRWLMQYGVRGAERPRAIWPPVFKDATHPYLAADLSRCIDCFRCVRICEEVEGRSVWNELGRGAGTRVVPDGPSLLASSCVSCGACVDTCPTGALEDQSAVGHMEPERWTRTVCPYCGVGCELFAGSRDGRVLRVKPVLDAPVNRGHLCVKGRYAFGFNHSVDRLTQPLLREGDEWRPISWPEAIQRLAGGLTEIRQRHGADSIGLLGSARGTNEENYLVQKFARVVLGTNNVDSCARVCHQPTAAGMKSMLGTGAATNSFADIEQAAGFLVFGCNPTEAHPVLGARIRRAVARGAALVVVDPRRTELAEMADVHLALRPGTNLPLLHAIAHTIVIEAWQDPIVFGDRISGWEEFRSFIGEWRPERAAEICGVSADAIRRAAEIYARCKPSMCFHGLGVTEQGQGTEGVMALVNLALITGNFGCPGSGINPLRGQNNVQGSAHMGCEPGHLTGFVPLAEGRDRFARCWESSIPVGPGLNLMEMIDAAAAGRLKAMWVIGYDILQTNPDTRVTRAALESLDFVVVQDLFMNELAREVADLVLPAASAFEKDGTFMNAERRVQRVRAVVPPPGEAKADWRILCEVAAAMGHGDGFGFDSPVEIWDEIRSLWPAGAGISYARLEQGGLQWPCPNEAHPGTAILHTDAFASGRPASLRIIDYEPTSETVTPEFPFLLSTGRVRYQFNSGTMTRRTANQWLQADDFLDMSAVDASALGLHDGDRVRIFSRHGACHLVLRVSEAMSTGLLFASFHSAGAGLNALTGPHRDRHEGTPEYKVVAVRVEPVP